MSYHKKGKSLKWIEQDKEAARIEHITKKMKARTLYNKLLNEKCLRLQKPLQNLYEAGYQHQRGQLWESLGGDLE